MHLGITIEQMNTITAHINAHMKTRGGHAQELRLTAEGMGDILVEYDLVTPLNARGNPYRFSVKMDGRPVK